MYYIVQTDEVVRLVSDKTFVYRDGVWVDTLFDPTVYQPVDVGFLSDDYFDLVEAQPTLGDYFALGPDLGHECFYLKCHQSPPQP